jgi:hypothetical protein
MRIVVRLPLVVFGAVLLSGCGGNKDLAVVRGTVTLDGQPLPNAYVVFAPTTKGTTSYGKTGADGKYEMLFTDKQKGAWVGENVVRISTGDLGTGGKAGPRERVPVVYNQQSTLKATVQPGENTFDFDLKSAAGKVVQPLVD